MATPVRRLHLPRHPADVNVYAWLVLATRPARTTRATTSQDAMNRPHDRTCRPALHLPVLAQLTMRLLHDGIPLTLLLDLSEPGAARTPLHCC